MADLKGASLPPSSQAPPPTSGGGLYVGAAIALLLAIGGLVFWKMRPDDAPPPHPIPSATVAAPTLMEPPPPPPPDEPEAGPTVAAPRPTSVGSCNGKCSGTATSTLTNALAGRAATAKGCYERALRHNSDLKGKLVLSVRIDSAGNACSASVTQDEIHSSEVSSCVTAMFRGNHFSAPSGGCIDVNLPLNFKPRDEK